VFVQTAETEAVLTSLLRPSVEIQTDVQEIDADLQSEIDELSALVTQLQDDKAILTTELCQLKSQQEVSEQMNQEMLGTDSATEVNAEPSADVSRELSLMSEQLHELQSTIAAQETQLRELSDEKLGLEKQLEKASAELESKNANFRQLQDTVSNMKGQLAAKTRILEETKDREDDLVKSVESCQAELRQSECKWHEVVEKKEQLVMELRADLDALTGSVQRREHMWDSARQSMEQEIETMRLSLSHQTVEHDSKVQVIWLYCICTVHSVLEKSLKRLKFGIKSSRPLKVLESR